MIKDEVRSRFGLHSSSNLCRKLVPIANEVLIQKRSDLIYESGSMEVLAMGTADRDGNGLFRNFRQFDTIQDNVRLGISKREGYKMHNARMG
jgi:hypothetical protein